MPTQCNYVFLTENELERVKQWRYRVVDGSLTTKLFTPLWNWMARYLPVGVAPNVITLWAAMCVAAAYHLVTDVDVVATIGPRTARLLAVAFSSGYITLDALDGKHARNTNNSSALGELFDHGCDNIGCAFQVVTLLVSLDVTDPVTTWWLVQFAQLGFLAGHIAPFAAHDKTLRFGFLTGPFEFACASLLLCAGHNIFGLGRAFAAAMNLARLACQVASPTFPPGMLERWQVRAPEAPWDSDDDDLLREIAFGLFCCGVMSVVGQLLYMRLVKRHHVQTSAMVLAAVVARALPAVLLRAGHYPGALSPTQTLLDGVFMSVLTSDMIVAKMAGREFSPLVAALAVLSVVSPYLLVAGTAAYYSAVSWDICEHLHLRLFSAQRTVYCDGVFDMLHRGHVNQFRQAIEVSGATRLVVGVISDKTAEGYKRKPIVGEQERYATVRAIPYVDQVIEDAPLVADKAFIAKHGIHVFACGEEYVNDVDDKYYGVPREMGMLLATRRTAGVSTTDLASLVLERGAAAVHNRADR